MRIAFFCMESLFSVQPLEALLAAGHDVRLVVRPIGGVETRNKQVLKRHPSFDVQVRRLLGLGAPVALSASAAHDPFAVATRAEIPAWLVGDASQPAMLRLLESAEVDLIVVAFFNQLLKPAVLASARLGAINLHPSLLPLYRGPAPLFWMFKDGVDEGGLSIHRVERGEDSGAVLEQTRVPIPFGTAGEDHVDTLADLAGAAVTRVVDALEAGTAHDVVQDASEATRAPRPKPPDLLVDRAMSARRAFQFVRGVGRWNDVRVSVGDRHVRVVDAVEIEEGRRLPGESAHVGDLLHVGFYDGVVTFRARAH
jgi:methionyl-tRNA formyltransferase